MSLIHQIACAKARVKAGPATPELLEQVCELLQNLAELAVNQERRIATLEGKWK
jgi:hypothetical protein